MQLQPHYHNQSPQSSLNRVQVYKRLVNPQIWQELQNNACNWWELNIREAEPFSIQQLLHPTPINCKRHHDASNYFEGLSQKLQRLSTEPPPNIPNEEEEGVGKMEGVKKILEDTRRYSCLGNPSCHATINEGN